uniref:hypothetical protein n=1 Tax=Megasphaera sp. TaxID=2023260 RepID=UPI0040263429
SKGNENPILGDEPITIGLWIGGEHTPNKLDDAKKELHNLKQGYGSADNNFQLLKCPWCGAQLTVEHGKGRWGISMKVVLSISIINVRKMAAGSIHQKSR